ncbi:unnamed protein product, partial [Musa textilis]
PHVHLQHQSIILREMDLWTVLRSGQRADESNTISNNRGGNGVTHVCMQRVQQHHEAQSQARLGWFLEGYSKEEEHETQGCKGLVGIQDW